MNAPWIRNVFIVTNGQIPSWLDTSNPRVKIVTHSEIYRDKTALPTFSSPSIELNLHHISNLSDYFIYLNDDVFFGSPVFPNDFMTESRTQYLFTSWRVPQCSSKCISEEKAVIVGRYSMLGNGLCDFGCNTELCRFDFGDCAVSNDTFDSFQRPGSKSEDTYRDSLVTTNLELIRMFGYKGRDVPAHMPHLMNRRVLEMIERNMTRQFNETMHHRFRESSDLQYAFLYFHYLDMAGSFLFEDPIVTFWKQIDIDHDDELNQNELNTLNQICFGTDASAE